MSQPKPIKIYVAGRVANDSIFGTHDWRDEFLETLSELSGIHFVNLDPVKKIDLYKDLEEVFGGDVYLIYKSDVVVVYLSDDIGIGASQEILIAQYFNKPVIGFAPKGGKFNGRTKKIGKQTIKNYRHPFVFCTCDVVCGDINELAKALKNLKDIKPRGIDLIKRAAQRYEKEYLAKDKYVSQIIKD